MTTTSTRATGSATQVGQRRVVSVVAWLAAVVVAALVGGGGIAKLAGDPTMITLFDQIGAGQWLRLVTGALEVAGAVGCLIPRLRVLAAGGLVLLLVCAAGTNVVVLGVSPLVPLVFAGLAGVVVALRRRELRRRR